MMNCECCGPGDFNFMGSLSFGRVPPSFLATIVLAPSLHFFLAVYKKTEELLTSWRLGQPLAIP